jgi:hypothetical protein
MGSFSDYLEAELLDHIMGMGTRNFTPPTNLYVALFTNTPTDAGGGVEVTGGNYARVSTSASDWNVATGTNPCEVDNANDITFPQATANWGTVTGFALFDAAAGGNIIMWADLTVSRNVQSGDTPEFKAGDLEIRLD